jgi:hypothetical protein
MNKKVCPVDEYLPEGKLAGAWNCILSDQSSTTAYILKLSNGQSRRG